MFVIGVPIVLEPKEVAPDTRVQGETPLPFKAMTVPATVTVEASAPMTDGVKPIVIEQVLLPATDVAQVFDTTLKSAALPPLKVGDTNVPAWVPVFWIVITCVPDALPGYWLWKL